MPARRSSSNFRTGRWKTPLLANVFVVGAGLAVLMLSSNPTIARLGFLLVASLVASGYTAIVLFSGLARPEREGARAGSQLPLEVA